MDDDSSRPLLELGEEKVESLLSFFNKMPVVVLLLSVIESVKFEFLELNVLRVDKVVDFLVIIV